MRLKARRYLSLLTSLGVWLWVVDSFGVLLVDSKGLDVGSKLGAILTCLSFDLLTVSLIGGLLLLPVLALEKWRAGFGLRFTGFFFASIILFNAVLTRYFSETLLFLGADLLGYSATEIWDTLRSVEDLSLSYVFLVVGLVAGFLLTSKFLSQFVSSRIMLCGFLISAIAAMILATFYDVNSKPPGGNKIAYLTMEIVAKRSSEISLTDISFESEFPLVRNSSEIDDVLGPFFNLGGEKPNFVFIVCEGLGRDFTGRNAEYPGFTPFLDSLADVSLTWENFVCNSGRSFGIMGSLFGSLPFGDRGFLELESPPNHLSLLSILNGNGYEVSYVEGSSSSFDRKINFLQYQGVEKVVDRSNYGPDYQPAEENELGFSWGYPDDEIFRRALASVEDGSEPRLDLIFTVSGHEPFVFPDRPRYEDRVRELVSKSKLSERKKEIIGTNESVFASLLYTDESIRDFLKLYSDRPEYEKTIFIITGDHRLIPIPHRNEICRFHVPFMIHSPMLKNPLRFSSVSSHLDVVPSLLAFLKNNYEQEIGSQVACLGSGIDTTRHYRCEKEIPLMKYKGSIQDFISGEYFISSGELLKISDGMSLDKVEDQTELESINREMNDFLKLNKYVVEYDRILPMSSEDMHRAHSHVTEFSEEDLQWILKVTADLSSDDMFLQAQNLAWSGENGKARLICDYILNDLPNHFDARILKARTLAWDGLHDRSEAEFLDAIRRNQYYYDGYMGLLDLYWWSGQDDKALALGERAQDLIKDHPKLRFKIARVLKRLNKTKMAIELTDGLLKDFPENSDYVEFRESFN